MESGPSTGVAPHVGCPTRPPGRPRSTEADRAITEATLSLLAEVGLGAFAVEEVAARAGVSKATIYRRFPNRDALIVESLAQVMDTAPRPLVEESESTRDVLVRMVNGMRDWYGDSPNGALMTRMLGYARSNPALFGCFYDRVIVSRRSMVKALLVRGVARGEIRTELDLDLAVTMIVSPTLYLATVEAGGRDAAPGSSAEQVVDVILNGLAPRPGTTTVEHDRVMGVSTTSRVAPASDS